MDRRAFVGLIVLLVETSKAFAGGTVAEFVVLPPRLAPVSLGRGAVYANSQTGRVRFLDTMGGSIEAGTADRIQTLLADPLSPSEGRIYGNTASHFLRYWDGSAWQNLATSGGTVPIARQVLTTAPLSGGGNLSADRTLSLMLAAASGLWVTGGALAVLPKPAGGLVVDASGVYVDATAVTPGSYPAAGQIPTFTVGVDGRLIAAGSTASGAGLTDIPNGALVNSSLTVTASSGLSGGGLVSLGGAVAVSMPNTGPGAGSFPYPTTITIDAQGRITAITAGAAPSGGIVTLAVVGTGAASVTWTANQYAGIASAAASSAATTIGAWSTEVPGVLKNFKYTSHLNNPAGAGRTVTVYAAPRVSGGCGAFVATTAVITMPLVGQGASNTTNPQALAAGDCILLRSNFGLATGAGGAITVTAQFIPN